MEALSLPQIDYEFWKEKNSYYSSKKLGNQTIRGIKTVQKTGLLNSVIDDDGNILLNLSSSLSLLVSLFLVDVLIEYEPKTLHLLMLK